VAFLGQIAEAAPLGAVIVAGERVGDRGLPKPGRASMTAAPRMRSGSCRLAATIWSGPRGSRPAAGFSGRRSWHASHSAHRCNQVASSPRLLICLAVNGSGRMRTAASAQRRQPYATAYKARRRSSDLERVIIETLVKSASSSSSPETRTSLASGAEGVAAVTVSATGTA
jgi:hypothetical protein